MSPTFHDDAELLRRYQAERTPAAFEALVARHLPLVWSTARRVLVSCPALAEDVAQVVFTDFARHALTLRADRPAGGWLHRHAWFTAATVLRSERRRRERETIAAMNDDRLDSPAATPHDDTWERLAPHLDEALAALPAADREAVVMRFFERWDFARIGAALRISDEAARKRVTRALEKLRQRLTRRGAVPAAAALGVLLGSHALAAPPAGLAGHVAAVSWARASATVSATGGATLVAKAWLALKSAPLAVPVVSVTLLCGVLWWWSTRAATPSTASRAPHVPAPPSLAAPGEALRVRGALFDVEESLAMRLLTERGRDDGALWERLTAAAVPALDPAPAPTTAHDSETPRPAVVAAAVFDESAASGRALEWKHGSDYEYPTEFEPRGMEPPLPMSDEARFVGTEIALIAGRKEKDGSRTVQWRLDHHFAPPVVRTWAVRVNESGGESEVGTSFPSFSSVTNAAATRLAADAPALVLAVKTPPPPGPASAETPPARRLLLFLQVDPAGAPSR